MHNIFYTLPPEKAKCILYLWLGCEKKTPHPDEGMRSLFRILSGDVCPENSGAPG
jgi:hypothetical protein